MNAEKFIFALTLASLLAAAAVLFFNGGRK